MTLPFLRGLVGALSLIILSVAIYLLATWTEGEIRVVDELLVRDRADWRLWAGLTLLAWSFLGRTPVLAVLTRNGGPVFSRAPDHSRVEGASGARLHIEAAGPADAPPILFTHGWGMDASIWTPQREALQDRFRLVFWDLPGLGLSRSAPGGPVTLQSFAESLSRVLDTLDRPAVLVGHSIGGMVMQTLARDRPELFGSRIAGVVLLNTTHTNPLKTMIMSGPLLALQPVVELGSRLVVWLQPLIWLQAWQAYLSGSTHIAMRFGCGPRVTRRTLDHVALLSTRNPPGVQARGNLAMFKWDATGALAGLPTPVMVIGGERDIVTKLEASRTLASTAARGDLLAIPRGNHMSPADEEALYNEAIAAFVDRLSGSGAAQT